MEIRNALIACAIIGAIFGAILIVAGVGSVESTTGHYFKDALHGTSVEQPAASVESAGDSLQSWAQGAIAIFTGLLVVIGLIYVGSKSQS